MPENCLILLCKTLLIDTLQHTLTSNQIEILKAALYFDVFKYPLTEEELFENSAIQISKKAFEQELEILISNKLLKKEGDFFLLSDRTSNDIEKRIAGNKGARDIMPVAVEYARKVAAFPFVEAVCLSGSISKNYFDEKGDVDFFIVAKPNRLWICRSFLILRYKTMPVRLRRYWCPNYLISSDNLIIPDINSFTGTEIAFLLPVVNYTIYKKILEKNSWYRNRFPNKIPFSDKYCKDVPKKNPRKLIEFILGGKFGNILDKVLLDFTLKRWRKKYPQLSDEDFDLQFRTKKDVCKRHTHGFQNKVLLQWQQNINSFEQKYNLVLAQEKI